MFVLSAENAATLDPGLCGPDQDQITSVNFSKQYRRVGSRVVTGQRTSPQQLGFRALAGRCGREQGTSARVRVLSV